MIVYIENPKIPQNKLLKLIDQFKMIMGSTYKVNIQESNLFLYPINKQLETEIYRRKK